jgi:hypothetical protein
MVLDVAGLLALAVDVQPHAQVLAVADLVRGDQPGADRAEGVAALALVPLVPPRSIWKARSETSFTST